MLLFKPIYLGAIGLQKLLNKLKTDEVHIERRKQAQEAKGLKNKFISALYSMADSAAAIPVAGWIAAAAILALAGITIAVGIAHVKQQEYNKSAEGAAENINAISNEIYKLNESATAIDNITNSFDKLDNKLIKTKEDLEEMHSLLQQGTEIMNSDEVDDKDDVGYGKGVNEKEHYEGLSDEEKKLYLARKQEEINLNLERKRQEQKNIIAGLTTEEREKLLSDKGTSPAVIKAQSAIYALNNSEIYKNIDLLKESSTLTTDAAQSLETMTQAMMENITASEAWEFTNDPHKIEVLTDALAKLETKAKNLQGEDVTLSAAEVLDSDDYSLKDRVEAYKQIRDELEALGDDYVSVLSGFNTEYSGFEKFAYMSDGVLEFSENVGLSADKINDL